MACFATPYGLRYAAHCFNRTDAQNNRQALIPAGGKLGVTSGSSALAVGPHCEEPYTDRLVPRLDGSDDQKSCSNPIDRLWPVAETNVQMTSARFLSGTKNKGAYDLANLNA